MGPYAYLCYEFWLRLFSWPFDSDESVRITHLNLAGVGDDGFLCLGLLLFRQKFRSSPGESPCPLVGGYLIGCTACTNAQGNPTGCTACTNAKKKREYSRNPTWDPPKVS